MSLRGTAFDAVELFLRFGRTWAKHSKIMCTLYTKIEEVNFLGTLGSGKHGSISWQPQGIFDVLLIRLCLSVHKNSDDIAVVLPLKNGTTKNKFIWLPWKCIKGAKLLIYSAVEQTSVLLLSKQFLSLSATDNTRCLLVPSHSLFSLSLFLRPPFLVDTHPHPRRHAPLALALSRAATPLNL